MRKGIFIPAVAVRATVGAVVAAAAVLAALSAPDLVRYVKMKTM